MIRIIHLRCRKCNWVFTPIKRKRRYQCFNCGARGSVGRSATDNFQKWTSKDIMIILNLLDKKTALVEESKVPVEPIKPDGAPGCWGSYQRKTFCRERCQHAHGVNVRKTCMEKTRGSS